MTNANAFMSRKNIVLGIVALVVIALIAYGMMNSKVGPTAGAPGAPEGLDAAQTAEIVAKLSAVTQVPTDETPMTQVIKGAEMLKKTQPFLENANDGDVIVLYPKAGLAFLFRPGTNEIIAAGPLHEGPPPSPAGTEAAP
jgi:hypothetical protein